MPPSRKNVITKARDKNHPATKKPVNEKTSKSPRRLISALSSVSIFLAACGKSSSSGMVGSPSLTLAGEAIARASLSVGNRNRDQKYNPNTPSSEIGRAHV